MIFTVSVTMNIQPAVAAAPKAVDVDVSCYVNDNYCFVTASYNDGTIKTQNVSPTNDATLPGIRTGWYSFLEREGNMKGFHSRVANSGENYFVAALTENPDTISVAQMPTTGAPEGLSAIGLLASVVAVLGLTSVLLFRKRV